MTHHALVAGVGIIKFSKPGQHQPFRKMAAEAVTNALKDANLPYSAIEQAYAAYIYGDSTCGQHALYDVGMTGIPIINVNNNCSSGSTALFLARQAVASGSVECALAFGFEEMQPGALNSHWDDRESPFDPFLAKLDNYSPPAPRGPLALRTFGSAANAYIEKTGANPNIYAKVAVKTRQHAIQNPMALFQQPLSIEAVMESPTIYPPTLTRFMACPPTCGAAAAIVCSPAFVKKHNMTRCVQISAQVMATDKVDTWDNPMDLIGAKMTHMAAQQVYEDAGIGPTDIDLVELHDCFTPNEVITYESLGLCAEGEAEKFINDGDNTYGGQFVVNPSGGLMSKGHPIGATGLAQCAELVTHLRHEAGARQVENVRHALQHNLGLGGAVVVTLYSR